MSTIEVESVQATPPVGVDAALRAADDPAFVGEPTLFQQEFSLVGRVATVTGGGRGLGLEMAQALAEAGATVYCLAKSTDPTDIWRAAQDYVLKLAQAKSSRLEYRSVDVSDQKAIWAAMEDIANKEGRIDICVAAAGIGGVVSCLEVSAEQFEETINVNVNGAFYTAQGAARQMKKRGVPGSIIFVSSIAASVSLQGTPATPYCASKAACNQMARCMAMELGQYGIRVNSLSPGYIPTDFNQKYIDADPKVGEMWASQNYFGRLGKRSEMRGIAVWLASDSSTFCTGSDIVIDGGHRAW
ncbi:hypothetical protein ACEPAI_9611 [Sanghuangporus weigelae]